MIQERRTLANRISSAFDGANLLTVEEISRFTGSNRRTVEREMVPLMRPYHVGNRAKYLVQDIAAVLDRKCGMK